MLQPASKVPLAERIGDIGINGVGRLNLGIGNVGRVVIGIGKGIGNIWRRSTFAPLDDVGIKFWTLDYLENHSMARVSTVSTSKVRAPLSSFPLAIHPYIISSLSIESQ